MRSQLRWPTYTLFMIENLLEGLTSAGLDEKRMVAEICSDPYPAVHRMISDFYSRREVISITLSQMPTKSYHYPTFDVGYRIVDLILRALLPGIPHGFPPAIFFIVINYSLWDPCDLQQGQLNHSYLFHSFNFNPVKVKAGQCLLIDMLIDMKANAQHKEFRHYLNYFITILEKVYPILLVTIDARAQIVLQKQLQAPIVAFPHLRILTKQLMLRCDVYAEGWSRYLSQELEQLKLFVVSEHFNIFPEIIKDPVKRILGATPDFYYLAADDADTAATASA